MSAPSTGKHQNERWTIVPSAAISPTAATVSAHDRRSGAQLAAKTVSVIGAAAAAGAGLTPKCIFIGDSLTEAADYTQELLTIAAADALKVALYGTQGTAPNSHEGRAGWTIANYTSDYTDTSTRHNPFWIGGTINFPQYLVDNSIAVPDWAFIMLGINDVQHQASDTAAISAATTAFSALDGLIASIKAAGVGVKVGLMTTTFPSAEQDAFAAGAGTTRWRCKRNIALWVERLISTYAGKEADRIYLVPTHVNLDTVNNMYRAAAAPVNSRSTVQVERQSNGVHPPNAGYYQIADSVWAFLKNNV
jgi:lysophospholipase L1-like esterase